ncbi:MAG TPA: biotin-dependent carboxyltransferase family protein [Flavisolibacter sp.]|nr:biotin-dependent carboxyltransferase family protein [Flavisolibacter sp.]
MSLRIIKAGLLDTIQDLGRFGYQHQGINPGGAMDRFSASLANVLLGKEPHAPVIEMHFPAPEILLEEACIICITGADFSPLINGDRVFLSQPVAVKASSILSWKGLNSGARCYLSLLNDLHLEKWLNSYSTNLKAGVGGFKGRRLLKGDRLFFRSMTLPAINETISLLPWQYRGLLNKTNEIEFIIGPEWNWLTTKSRTTFLNEAFKISPASDRMGYRMHGHALEQTNKEQLISSAVTFGTVQLLPDGQLIVLMADHQTTGGYPRIASIITPHLPTLAQMIPGDELKFVMTDIASAEEKLVDQQKYLQQLQNTCKLKMQNWLNEHRS